MGVKPKKIISAIFLLYFAMYAFSPLSLNFREGRLGDLSLNLQSLSLKNISFLLLETCYKMSSQDDDAANDDSSSDNKILLVKKKSLLSSVETLKRFISVGDVEMMPVGLFADGGELSYPDENARVVGSPQNGFRLTYSPNSPPNFA